MADGRMLKKRISSSTKFAALKTDKARVLYLMLLPHTDVEGRIEANPALIAGQITTLLKYTPRQIQSALEDMHDVGLVILYKVNGEQYLEVTKFSDFQNLRPGKEADSKIPAPSTGVVPDKDGSSPAKDKRREEKIREEKEKVRHLDFVLLTEDEYKKLIEALGGKRAKDYIERLNGYVGAKGDKYKSHYYTVLNWARRDGVIGKKAADNEQEKETHCIVDRKAGYKSDKNGSGEDIWLCMECWVAFTGVCKSRWGPMSKADIERKVLEGKAKMKRREQVTT